MQLFISSSTVGMHYLWSIDSQDCKVLGPVSPHQIAVKGLRDAICTCRPTARLHDGGCIFKAGKSWKEHALTFHTHAFCRHVCRHRYTYQGA